MLRFVILYHQMPPGSARRDHWDLMLESRDGFLWTWAFPPPLNPNTPVAATRLADHRSHYLEYEGPISDGRGEVWRIDAGSYATQTFDDFGAPNQVLLHGSRIRGRLRLTQVDNDNHWILQLECDPEVVCPTPHP